MAHDIPQDTRKYGKAGLFSQSPLCVDWTCRDTKAVLDFVVMSGDTIIFLPRGGKRERDREKEREATIRQRNRTRMKIPLSNKNKLSSVVIFAESTFGLFSCQSATSEPRDPKTTESSCDGLLRDTCVVEIYRWLWQFFVKI